MKIETRAGVEWCRTGMMLAVLLAFCACTPPPGVTWTKEGITQDGLKRDQKACVAESGDYGFLLGPNSGQIGAVNQQADIYQACMTQKGYSPASPGALPPAGSDEQAQ
ncbi:MAG TPA: hypothetical protein VI113_12465 [Alphaproteobacteria bacterium]